MVVSDRVFSLYERGSRLRRRALIWSCGCSGGTPSAGLDIPIRSTECLWHEDLAPDGLGLDFAGIRRLNTLWCRTHGAEFCEAIVTGRRAGGYLEERLRSHYESLSRVIRFTRTADMKAAPVLALQLALTGALASRVDRLVPIVTTGPCDVERIALVVVGLAYLLCLAGAIWAAAMVYVPRSPKTGQSFIFFEDIAAMEYSAFESKARNMNSVLIEQQLIDRSTGFQGSPVSR